MSLAKISLLLLVFTCIVAACGLRGPLYLPDEEQTTKPATEQGAGKAQKKEQENEDGDNLQR